MILKSGWTKAEIESITYEELFYYVDQFYRIEADELFTFFKAFCFYNAESSAVAFSSEKGAMTKYARDLKNRNIVHQKENDIEDQFKELNLG